MKIRELILVILFFCSCPLAYPEAESPSRLIGISLKIQKVTCLSLSFSSLPEYELYELPPQSQAVVRFINTEKPKDCETPEPDGILLKEIKLTHDEHILRLILRLGEGVRLRVYPIRQARTLIIELWKEIDVRGGVKFRSFISKKPSARVSIVSLNLNDPGLYMRPVLANDKVPGLERTSSMVKRLGALGGINASYFMPNGDPLGLLILDGEMVSEPILNRSTIGYTQNRGVIFGRVSFMGRIHSKLDGRILRLDGINRRAGPKEAIIYTPHYGRKTGRKDAGVELSIVQGKIAAIHSKDGAIPPDGYLLSLPRPWTALDFSPWDEIEITYGLPLEFEEAIWAIAAGPTLVKDGKVNLTSLEEDFRRDVAEGANARSAIGLTFDERLLLITVDRTAERPGMSLKELAELMAELGVRDGINLDGGSSSTLVYQDRIVNSPSNGKEQPVASALLIFDRREGSR